MSVGKSEHASEFSVARAHKPAVFLGFHMVGNEVADVPIRSLKLEIAELLSSTMRCDEGRYTITEVGDIVVFDNNYEKSKYSIAKLDSTGDLHYFQRFKPRNVTKESVMDAFNNAKQVARSLKWPMKQHGGGDYSLHRSEIEIYLMGGTKRLKTEYQFMWRNTFKEFGEEVYQAIAPNEYFVDVMEEKTPIKFDRKNNYKSGYLKSIVKGKMRLPDLKI